MKKYYVRQIIKEEVGKTFNKLEKFSIVEKEKYGLEYVVAYPDENGIETKHGLENWEMEDSANREIYFEKDKKTAEEVLKTVVSEGKIMEMTDTKQLEIYADSLVQYFGYLLLDYEDSNYDNYLAQIQLAILHNEIDDIPKEYIDDALKLAVEKTSYLNGDDYNDSMDGDFDSAMTSAGMGTDEDYGYYGENVIRDANEILHWLNESNASRKAKKLGLVHIGFGNYADEKGASAKYKTVNGKLKKVGGMTVKKQKVSAKPTTTAKKKEEPKKKKVQSGVKDLRRVSGEKFTYEFEKDGRKYKFTLNKKERKELKDKSIMSIVKARLEKRAEKEKTKQFKKGKPVSSDSK